VGVSVWGGGGVKTCQNNVDVLPSGLLHASLSVYLSNILMGPSLNFHQGNEATLPVHWSACNQLINWSIRSVAYC
jgi:hypothetical protein